MADHYDYIIVGAGSAGCVLANRLSADPQTRVLLIEAGGRDKSNMIHMPAGLAAILPPEKAHATNWGYWTEPQQHLAGRRLYWPRGRVLGGSSSINGMVYIRGHSSDYDRWAQLGCTGWGWDDVLPYFKRAEDSERGETEFHGSGGPLHTSKRSMENPLVTAFLEAARQAGHNITEDFNGPQFEGAGRYDSTIKGGARHSAAKAYLAPVLERKNLDVRTGVRVDRVLFKGRCADAIAFHHKGKPEVIGAREIILSGGAINSPQTLMLSGIGPGRHLKDNNIDVVVDAPDVGGNLQDHLDLLAQWQIDQAISLNANRKLSNKLRALAAWTFRKDGTASHMPTPAGAFLTTREGLAAPDVQLHLIPGLANPHGRGKMPPTHGFTIHVCQLRPESRGTIRLASPDPAQHPKIDPNYLSVPEDTNILLKGLEITREIGRQPAFKAFGAKELWPGGNVSERPQLIKRMREWAETIYHPVGTCRMGSDEEAVLDPGLRVRGVEGLRVVDASVMPTLISGNTNAPTIMIAEKASDMIRAEAKQKLAA